MSTEYILRFTNNLLNRIRNNYTGVIKEEELTHDEYKYANKLWIREEQREIRKQHNYTKLHASLNLFEDDHGFLSLKGDLRTVI